MSIQKQKSGQKSDSKAKKEEVHSDVLTDDRQDIQSERYNEQLDVLLRQASPYTKSDFRKSDNDVGTINDLDIRIAMHN